MESFFRVGQLGSLEVKLSQYNFIRYMAHIDKEALMALGSNFSGHVILPLLNDGGGIEYTLFVLMEEFKRSEGPGQYFSADTLLSDLDRKLVPPEFGKTLSELLESFGYLSFSTAFYDTTSGIEKMEEMVTEGIINYQAIAVYGVKGENRPYEVYRNLRTLTSSE